MFRKGKKTKVVGESAFLEDTDPIKQKVYKLLRRRRVKIIYIKIAVVCLVIFAIAGGAFLYKSNQKSKTSREDSSFIEMQAKYKDYQSKHVPNAAKEVVEQYLATKPENKSQKAQAEYYLANIYISLNDPANAKKHIEEAIKNTDNPTFGMYLFAGDVAKSQKDYKAAGDYYQKAVDLLKLGLEKNPTLGIQKVYLENNIQLMKDNLAQQQADNNENQ